MPGQTLACLQCLLFFNRRRSASEFAAAGQQRDGRLKRLAKSLSGGDFGSAPSEAPSTVRYMLLEISGSLCFVGH